MKRVILGILVLTGMLFVLSGCSNYYENEQNDRFIRIKRWWDNNGSCNVIIYDKETKVEYWWFDKGITVLVDAEGKPLLYEGE